MGGRTEAGGSWAWPSLRPGGTRCRPRSPGGAGEPLLPPRPSARRGLVCSRVLTTPGGRPGERAGGRRCEPSPGLGLFCTERASAGAELGCKAQAAAWGLPFALSLPAPVTPGGAGSEAFSGGPLAAVSVGPCVVLVSRGSVAAVVRERWILGSHPFCPLGLASLVAGPGYLCWGRIFADNRLLLLNSSLHYFAKAWSC